MNRVIRKIGLLALVVVVAACTDSVSVTTPAPVSEPSPTYVAVIDTPSASVDVTSAPLPTDPPAKPSAPAQTDTPNPTANPTPTATPTPTPTATATPTATPTASPTATAPPTPTVAPSTSPTPSNSPSQTPTPSPTTPPDLKLLATWTTHFIPSVLNGQGINIRVPAKRINNTTVKPGQMFQFINSIAPVTVPPFAKGAWIRNGQFVLDPAQGIVGGGMCSASTTLFNAALRAGLKIVERHNHSVYIPRYPVGLDATVFSTGQNDGQDVKFVNDMDHPIVIRATGLKRSVTFEIWGVDDGRTVHLSAPVVTNVVKAPSYYVYTDDLAPGVTQHIQDAYDGFHSVVVRTVKDANGNTIWKDTFTSQYRMLPGLASLGRKPGDPPAGTRILVPGKNKP